ncbi:hypothetical protein SAMN04488074_109210 [Lentzea albidocapillata subsp. violacea]|uniref:Phage gp6-like head-tail connector protein n=1 Tax=Lentzea albidocapillata subsp. violacea TaxID=128104 RepID=A0A1G9HYI8_9PSEU|nr:hypothetical protein [Lentzea albidocapillata]SDL18031.1 hypothetical protein SAMN04488074_109210 [Lentzea albidocapillata subsp. violacea]
MRVYATVDELRDYAGAHVVTEDSPRRLARASELVDSHLLAAVYAVDAQGYPTGAEERDALRRATCAVVEWWHETGDPVGAAGQYSESQIGTVRLKRADPAVPSDIAPNAVRILTTAGLLSQFPIAPDRWATGYGKPL